MKSTMQDRDLSITSLVRHGTTVHGDRHVITATGDGFRRASYAELAQRISRLAGALRQLGITDDQRVATFQWNNQEHLEVYCAVPAMGAVLHTLNIRLSSEQIDYIANHAEDRVVVVDLSLAPLLAPVLPRLKTVHTVIAAGQGDLAPLEESGKTILRYEELLAAAPPEFRWPDVNERSAAAMCYTSGTTGNPKGVVYSHRSAYLHSMSICAANGLAVGESDRLLPIVPMFHANAWGLPYAALMAGAELLLPDRFLQPAPLVEMIEKERPTLAGAVPTIWSDVLQYLERNPGRDLSSLRLVACGGSAVPEWLMQAFLRDHGVEIVQAWGMTETSPLATVARPPDGTTGEDYWRRRSSQGRPVCGVEVRIVDDTGNELPCDDEAVGEVEVRGPWVTGSYFHDDTSDKFDNGWLRTGDVGRIDGRGFVTLTDRAKDVIKSGGEWISSVELENLIAAHPAVREAAVIAVPDDRWQERPLGAVVMKPGATVTAKELRDWLDGKVARWWLPERWTFIEQVPRTGVGKYDKKVLRGQYAEGLLDVEEIR